MGQPYARVHVISGELKREAHGATDITKVVPAAQGFALSWLGSWRSGGHMTSVERYGHACTEATQGW